MRISVRARLDNRQDLLAEPLPDLHARPAAARVIFDRVVKKSADSLYFCADMRKHDCGNHEGMGEIGSVCPFPPLTGMQGCGVLHRLHRGSRRIHGGHELPQLVIRIVGVSGVVQPRASACEVLNHTQEARMLPRSHRNGPREAPLSYAYGLANSRRRGTVAKS
jgi:hypothetical protein